MINLVRPFLHIFRVVAHKLLGITTVPRSVTLRLDRLLDRVLLLESHVNWRLNGLPSQLGNVRLEQLALASGTASTEALIARLDERHARADEASQVDSLTKEAPDGEMVCVGSRGLASLQSNTRKITLIADTDDLHTDAWLKSVAPGARLVEAPPLAYLEAVADGTLAAVWLGESALRAPYIKSLLTIEVALKKTRVGGVVAGYCVPQGADPRVVRPFDPSWLGAIGVDGAAVTMEGATFRIRR